MELSAAQQIQLFRSSRALLESLRKGKSAHARDAAWNAFSSELLGGGVPDLAARGAVAALRARLARVEKEGTPPLRQLHQVEREIVSTEAWGLLLDSVRLGLIDGRNTDDILEQTAQRYACPVQRSGVEQALARNWNRMLSSETPSGLLPS